jgi:hypothetical protein
VVVRSWPHHDGGFVICRRPQAPPRLAATPGGPSVPLAGQQAPASGGRPKRRMRRGQAPSRRRESPSPRRVTPVVRRPHPQARHRRDRPRILVAAEWGQEQLESARPDRCSEQNQPARIAGSLMGAATQGAASSRNYDHTIHPCKPRTWVHTVCRVWEPQALRTLGDGSDAPSGSSCSGSCLKLTLELEV